MRKLILSLIPVIIFPQQSIADIPRTLDGSPDLSGNYDVATLTPLQRPKEFGNNLYLSKDAADKITAAATAAKVEGDKQISADREAPPAGGDGSSYAAGNVGGYNSFWIDNGDSRFQIDGKFRTSIIYHPENGRSPEMTKSGKARRAKRLANYQKNTGTAWWLERQGPGPYDGPESRTLSDRCLSGFGSTGGPPMLPVLYNNVKRIVQTPEHVMILVEMVHDVRMIRLNSKHVAPDIRKWMGDSIGHWEGNTLVVDTSNFTDKPALTRATRDLHVVERFTPVDENTLQYSFTVEDPNTWTKPWSGEYPWPKTDNSIYEYACHEGNYAMGNILRGARILEDEAINGKQ